nr:IclR family transcriptional regulator C-terminal domain-containing protein [Tomitella biformata]
MLQLNRWLPVHSGASGLAILAFLPAADRRDVLQGSLAVLTQHTMVDAGQLTDRLAQIRRRGYASSRSERIVGAVAVAAPVFAPEGRVYGDVGLTIPESRFDEEAEAVLAEQVMRSAQILTDSLVGVKPTY